MDTREQEIEEKLREIDLILEERKKLFGELSKLRKAKWAAGEQEEARKRQEEEQRRQEEARRSQEEEERKQLEATIEQRLATYKNSLAACVLHRENLNEQRALFMGKIEADVELIELRRRLEERRREVVAFYDAQLVDGIEKMTELHDKACEDHKALRESCMKRHPPLTSREGYDQPFADETAGYYFCCRKLVQRRCNVCEGSWMALVGTTGCCPAGN